MFQKLYCAATEHRLIFGNLKTENKVSTKKTINFILLIRFKALSRRIKLRRTVCTHHPHFVSYFFIYIRAIP